MLAASHQWKGIQCDVSVKKRAEATALRGGVGVEPRLSSSGSCPFHVQGLVLIALPKPPADSAGGLGLLQA